MEIKTPLFVEGTLTEVSNKLGSIDINLVNKLDVKFKQDATQTISNILANVLPDSLEKISDINVEDEDTPSGLPATDQRLLKNMLHIIEVIEKLEDCRGKLEEIQPHHNPVDRSFVSQLTNHSACGIGRQLAGFHRLRELTMTAIFANEEALNTMIRELSQCRLQTLCLRASRLMTEKEFRDYWTKFQEQEKTKEITSSFVLEMINDHVEKYFSLERSERERLTALDVIYYVLKKILEWFSKTYQSIISSGSKDSAIEFAKMVIDQDGITPDEETQTIGKRETERFMLGPVQNTLGKFKEQTIHFASSIDVVIEMTKAMTVVFPADKFEELLGIARIRDLTLYIDNTKEYSDFITSYHRLPRLLKLTMYNCRGEQVSLGDSSAIENWLTGFLGEDKKSYILSPGRVVFCDDDDTVLGTTVREGTIDGKPCAIKIVSLSMASVQTIIRFLEYTTRFENPYVVKTIGVIPTTSGGDRAIGIVMEKAAMNLAQFWERRHLDSEASVLRATQQIAKGLSYLHSKNLSHGNLKIQNILLFKTKKGGFVAKISDFQFLHQVREIPGLSTLGSIMSSPAMGINYITPQIIGTNGRAIFSRSNDIFVLGHIVHFMLTGNDYPFGRTEAEVTKALKDQRLPDLSGLGDFWKDLLKKLWTFDRHYRPNIQNVIHDITSLRPASIDISDSMSDDSLGRLGPQGRPGTVGAEVSDGKNPQLNPIPAPTAIGPAPVANMKQNQHHYYQEEYY